MENIKYIFIFLVVFCSNASEIQFDVGYLGDSLSLHMLGAHPKSHSINATAGGSTTAQMLARLDEDVLKYNPKRILIFGGTNDLIRNIPVEDMVSNIEDIATRSLAALVVPYVVLIPPLGGNYESKNLQLELFNLELDEMARRRGITVIDAHSVFLINGLQNKSLFNKDLVHPNSAGLKLLNSIIAEAL